MAYEWTFGDGSATAAGVSANHVYSTAGTYVAQLKVTDNSGLSATKSVTITVNPVVAVVDMRVADIAMSLQWQYPHGAGGRQGDGPRQAGQPVTGATVSGTWSGVVSGAGSALTASTGVASLTSPSTKSRGYLHLHRDRRGLAGLQLPAVIQRGDHGLDHALKFAGRQPGQSPR